MVIIPRIKRVIQATNINYFHNHFGVPIFKERVNNAFMSLTLAPPEHDCTFCQVGVGKLPVTDQLIVRNIYQNRAWNISRIQGEELCFFLEC